MDKNKAAFKLKGLPHIYYLNLDEEPERMKTAKLYPDALKILNKWYKNLFTWLDKCESKLGFSQFKNYETRIYAFLSERYISYWFKKYSKYHELPWTFFEND